MPVAVVTGASAGIGLETARGLAKKSFDLILVSRSLKELKTIKGDLETQYSIKCDVFSYDLSLIKSDGHNEILFIFLLYFFALFFGKILRKIFAKERSIVTYTFVTETNRLVIPCSLMVP